MSQMLKHALPRRPCGEPLAGSVAPLQFLLPTSIETARCADAEPFGVPDDLADAYFAAWRSVPGIVAACVARDWDDTFCRSATAALCAAKGQVSVAEALLSCRPEYEPQAN